MIEQIKSRSRCTQAADFRGLLEDGASKHQVQFALPQQDGTQKVAESTRTSVQTFVTESSTSKGLRVGGDYGWRAPPDAAVFPPRNAMSLKKQLAKVPVMFSIQQSRNELNLSEQLGVLARCKSGDYNGREGTQTTSVVADNARRSAPIRTSFARVPMRFRNYYKPKSPDLSQAGISRPQTTASQCSIPVSIRCISPTLTSTEMKGRDQCEYSKKEKSVLRKVQELRGPRFVRNFCEQMKIRKKLSGETNGNGNNLQRELRIHSHYERRIGQTPKKFDLENIEMQYRTSRTSHRKTSMAYLISCNKISIALTNTGTIKYEPFLRSVAK